MRWRSAMVTGASSGIGESFARLLAARGSDVVLVARRGDLLERLAGELSARFGVRAEALAVDLTDPGGLERAAGRAVPRIHPHRGRPADRSDVDGPRRRREAGLEAVRKGRALCVPGAQYKMLLPAMRLAPRGVLRTLSTAVWARAASTHTSPDIPSDE
jgi:NAD(P)-dependent dehydrogenase (short-subunit alcohol dehydrogenase family)